MISWDKVPALRLAIFISLGIAFSSQANWETSIKGAIALASLSIILVLFPVGHYLKKKLKGLAVIVASIVLGLMIGELSTPKVVPLPLDEIQHHAVEITSDPNIGAKWIGATGQLIKYYDGEKWIDSTANIQLFLASTFKDSSLGKGAQLITSAKIKLVSKPLNPHSFDYKNYLNQKAIGHTCFVKASQAMIIKQPNRIPFIERLRKSIAVRLKSALPTQREFSVAQALVLGKKEGLDKNTRDIYSRTGAIHVLAVSGLHTGIIAYILIYILGLLKDEKWKWIKLILFCLGLFSYVALTGYSASVQRSALMFGILFAGKILRQSPNAFNSLGISAALLLVLNPQLLFNLGFQLSYLAVGGILAFYPTLRRLLSSSNIALNYVGELSAISIAATIATAPLVTYHFHQFPLYFLLSGIVAVPLVSIALPLLLAALVGDGVSLLLGLSLEFIYLPGYYLIWLNNAYLSFVAALPSAAIEGLWPSTYTTALFILLSTIWGVGLLKKSKRLFFTGIFTCVLISASIILDSLHKAKQEELIVYGIRKSIEIDAFKAGKHIGLSPKPTTIDKFQNIILPHRAAMGHRSIKKEPITGQGMVGQHADRSWLVIPKHLRFFATKPPATDVVILQNSKNIDLQDLSNVFGDKKIILTDYIPQWQYEKWNNANLSPHVLPLDGAFVIASERY